MSNSSITSSSDDSERSDSDLATKGVALGFASFAAFSFSDASVKLIERTLPYEATFFGALFALAVFPFVGARVIAGRMSLRRPIDHCSWSPEMRRGAQAESVRVAIAANRRRS